jgi:hypothetical protein
MNGKKLKDWANSLPDNALILVHASRIMSFPLKDPVLHAIDNGSIEYPVPGMTAGKVISSLSEEE